MFYDLLLHHTVEELNGLRAFGQFYISFFAVGAEALVDTHSLFLTGNVGDGDLLDLNTEDGFNSGLNFGLVAVGSYFENVGFVICRR